MIPTGVRAFVSGGASGLGRALCLELAQKRAKVAVADVDEDGAQETARLVEKSGGEAFAARCDVREVDEVEACASQMDERFGGVDLVINNAGVACAGKVGEVSLEDWRWITDINQWGVIHGCHVFVPRLVAAGRGWVLNIASMAAIAALPEMAPYNVTKAAVVALSETLHTELAPHNINVSVACPTFFPTNLLASFRSPPRQQKFAAKMFERAKLTPADVARDSLEALERNTLIVIPQREGKMAALLKRTMPSTYFRMLKRQQAKMTSR